LVKWFTLILIFTVVLAGAEEAGKLPGATTSGMRKSFVPPRSVTPPINVNVVGVLATNENQGRQSIDPALAEVKSALSDLSFDTYRKLCDQTLSAPFERDTRCALNDKYTLIVNPISKEANGQVRLNLRVEMTPKNPTDKPITAVSTTIVIAPGKQFKVRGLKADRGEVVAIISLKP